MFNVTRRQALAASGGLLSTLLAPRRFASAAAGGTLNIAYNVNLPSFDPNIGPSSVNPTLQSIYRSVFDNYIGQKPDLSFEPGLFTGGAGMTTRARFGWTCGKALSGTTVAHSRLKTSFGRSSATPSRTAAIRCRS